MSIVRNIALRVWYIGLGFCLALFFNPVQAAGSWSCSSFFINPDGYIATAQHCVSGGDRFMIKYKGRLIKAHVVATDWFHDVAILKTELSHTPYLALSDIVYKNQYMGIIGYPLWSIRPVLSVGAGNPAFWMQYGIYVRAGTCQGNSGGPILNTTGVAVGVLTEGVSGFNQEGTCSKVSYGPNISYIIRLANKNHVSVYLNYLQIPRSFDIIFKETTTNNTVPVLYGESK